MDLLDLLEGNYATLQAKGKYSKVLEEALQRLGCALVQGVKLSPSQAQQAKLHCCSKAPGDALTSLGPIRSVSL